MSYTFSLEKFDESYPELEALYREHYAEMCARLAEQGIEMSPFKPRLDVYSKASNDGWLLNIVTRDENGKAVGYCNVYITNDMHNGDLIAQEDTIFITKNHRNGIGKQLVKFGMDELRKRGVKRLNVQAATDLRVAKLWERMGYKHASHSMTYTF